MLKVDSVKAKSDLLDEKPLIADQTPRFVTCVNHDVYNGNLKEYSWDKEKIFVHECLQDDLLMLQNVFEGKIISPLMYPLVFNNKSLLKEVSVRSLEFYKEVQNDASLYRDLSFGDKIYFLIGLRDLFIAAARDMLSQDEKQMLVNIVEFIDPNEKNIAFKTINNMDIAPYPTAVHKMVRFIDEKAEGTKDRGENNNKNNILEEFFVRNELGLLIGFVDPRELSFHNFENIVNLDSLFDAEEDFRISNFQQHGNNGLYTFDLDDSNKTLLSLDKCGLYTQPLNKLSRGGERFIFASQVLGDALSTALRKYVKDEDPIDEDFKFVNYVFRYNKFKPGDKKFTSHYDTPYHDPSRTLFSKYTLILYLTPGTADPVLSIDNGNLRIDQIENNGQVKGVIFDQKYEHEGKCFVDSDKIFIRTELISDYTYEKLSFDPAVSRKFNIACYMTKQSVFNPALEKYASDCFNQVAQARLNLANIGKTKDILVYKKYRGVSFVTNGYDYWFQKNISLKAAAVMTVLDYFGCKYKDYNSIFEGYGNCYGNSYGYKKNDFNNEPDELKFDEVINNLEEIKDVKDIFRFLKNRDPPSTEEECKLQDQENNKYDLDEIVEDLTCYFGEENDARLDLTYKMIEKEDCPMCREIHPTKDGVKEFLKWNHSSVQESLDILKNEFTMFIFNKEIRIEKSNIQINSDTIVFNEKIPSVNFASCQYSIESDAGLNKEELYVTGYANIPPLPYIVHDEGYHIKIELFNNGFVRDDQFSYDKFTY